jgi:hypothetical protein
MLLLQAVLEGGKLNSLCLSLNESIGDVGLRHIAGVLSHVGVQEKLVLDVSLVGATHLPAIFLSHLDAVNVSGNCPMVAEEVASVIDPATIRVKTLTLVGTGLNPLSCVFRQLHLPSSLTTLECGGIPMSEEDRAALRELNMANPELDVAVDKGEQL